VREPVTSHRLLLTGMLSIISAEANRLPELAGIPIEASMGLCAPAYNHLPNLCTLLLLCI
jgi:hypothetical protein